MFVVVSLLASPGSGQLPGNAPSALSELEAEVRWATDEVRTIDWVERNTDRVRGQIEALEIGLSKLPTEPGVEAWLEHLREMAATSDLLMTSATPLEPVQHDGYEEIPIELVLVGSANEEQERQSVANLGLRVSHSARITSWEELGKGDRGFRVRSSLFVAPAIEPTLRECRHWSPGEIGSSDRAKRLEARLVTACERLEGSHDLRMLNAHLEAIQDRIALIAKLKAENSAPPDDDDDLFEDLEDGLELDLGDKSQ